LERGEKLIIHRRCEVETGGCILETVNKRGRFWGLG